MRSKSFAGMACSVAAALEAIGDRWAILLLRDLMLGLARFDEFQISTGMPAQTLSDRLKQLEAAGLVERRRYQERPPRFEYVLTPKGRDLWKVVTALREWGDRWILCGPEETPVHVVDRETGRPVELSLVDASSGVPVPHERIEPRAGPGADELAHFRLGLNAERRGRDGA